MGRNLTYEDLREQVKRLEKRVAELEQAEHESGMKKVN